MVAQFVHFIFLKIVYEFNYIYKVTLFIKYELNKRASDKKQ